MTEVFGHRAKRRVCRAAGRDGASRRTVGIAACGDDDDDSGGGGAAAEGGEITMAQTSQPDYLDPALGYTVNGYEPFLPLYTRSYTYPHVEGEAGTELIPGPCRGPARDLRGRARPTRFTLP